MLQKKTQAETYLTPPPSPPTLQIASRGPICGIFIRCQSREKSEHT